MKVILIIISIVISATVAILAYNISEQVDSGFKNTAAYYDMIIGPSGSSTQLAMNTMFFTDKPLGTISYEYVEELEKDNRINVVVPFTMGDSYNGVKIIGTIPLFLETKELKSGEMFNDEFEAVIGYNIAKRYGLEIGSKIVTSHGLSEGGHTHETNPLVITGILKETKTSYDNVVFTSIHTVWETHDHSEENEEHEHGEVCAILLKTKSFNYYNAVKQQYSEYGNLLVINPAEVLREVLENVDTSSQIIYIMCVIILIMK